MSESGPHGGGDELSVGGKGTKETKGARKGHRGKNEQIEEEKNNKKKRYYERNWSAGGFPIGGLSGTGRKGQKTDFLQNHIDEAVGTLS